MEESLFQTFLLLAYFDIALLSITIAVYAVSASYLGRETRFARWRISRRIGQLTEKVKELNKMGDKDVFKVVDEMNKEKGKCQSEITGLIFKLKVLSWWGAVLFPSIIFGLSLILAISGINSTSPEPFINASSFFVVIGFFYLMFVIKTVDSAASRIPLPSFEVSFDEKKKTIECEIKEQQEIRFNLTNKGEEVAEDVQLFVFFPPSFKVHSPQTAIQSSSFEYAGYTAAIFDVKLIHIDVSPYFSVTIDTPDKEGKYEIPITVFERKTDPFKDKLLIEVKDILKNQN